MTDQAKTTVSDEELAAMLAGLEGVTPGPWQVIVTEHPWALPERTFLGQTAPAKTGTHKERRIFTTWDHPQAHAPEMVVNGATGIGMPDQERGIHFVSIDEQDAAHIARCDPGTMRSLLTELSARRATADVTEAMVERAGQAIWKEAWISSELDRRLVRAALLAALNPPMGRRG